MAQTPQKSILIQVAFKEAVHKDFEDNADLMRITDDYYQVLNGLHEKYDAWETAKPSGGGGAKRTPKNQDGPADEEAPTVTVDGDEYYDLRGFKELELRGEMYPDFKKVGDTSRNNGVWLKKKDGSPTQFAQKVAAAGV